MSALPMQIDHVGTPPIKCQGIKTRLVPFIFSNVKWSPDPAGRWIEPFLGSGVVAFNLAPERALLTDTNRHIINLYQSINEGSINGESLRDYLLQEGKQLQLSGVDHFYAVRERFNQSGNSFDFIFLSRSCFNGVMRFNGGGRFNVPFCHKPDRFSKAYVTKIVNQVNWVARQMRGKQWEFRVASWPETLAQATSEDFVYLDPPYIGRHTDYYNNWSSEDATTLARRTALLPCGYALSMWYENKYRHNSHIDEEWAGNTVKTLKHFYHVGSTESLRNEMIEALVIRSGFAAELCADMRVSTLQNRQESLRV